MYGKLIIAGNLGRDPEQRFTTNGQGVTNLSVATNRKYNNADGKLVTETVWYRVSVWGKQGDNAHKYLRKGSGVLIEGRLKPDPETGGPRVYTDQNGEARASYEVVAETVRFLGNGGNGANGETTDDVLAEPKEIDF